jgi:hypothetical protein
MNILIFIKILIRINLTILSRSIKNKKYFYKNLIKIHYKNDKKIFPTGFEPI